MDAKEEGFPHAEALAVAKIVGSLLKPACHRIAVAGSLRRGNKMVGDVELVYIPKFETRRDPVDFFLMEEVNLSDEVIATMESLGILCRRLNSAGHTTFGPKNKLMLHKPSGIPVDLFATSEACWENYMVCRTGPSDSNAQIATLAQRIGYHWQPYGPGFMRNGSIVPMATERDVFKFVGMKWPNNRVEIEI